MEACLLLCETPWGLGDCGVGGAAGEGPFRKILPHKLVAFFIHVEFSASCHLFPPAAFPYQMLL